MRTALYRQFADDKSLLYVGISLNAQNRLSQHYKSSAWFTEVTDVKIEWFGTREEALKAEVDAIHAEKPKCNIHHNLQAERELEEAPQEEAAEKFSFPKRKLASFWGFQISTSLIL